MKMTFTSEPEAYVFYNSYARYHGFSISGHKTKPGKGAEGKKRFRRSMCSREGKWDN
jgi:hypothetical protein